jgi:hypothetical protein
MNKTVPRLLYATELAVCGAILGLHAVKGLGFIGIEELTLRTESITAFLTGSIVLALRLTHRI